MFKSRHLFSCTFALLLAIKSVAADPLVVPPGQDPGGPAVAVITPPFDLNDADLKSRLARDGEGEAIGWDFSKSNAQDGGETAESKQAPAQVAPEILPLSTAVRTLISDAHMRLIPAFIAPGDAPSWAKAIAFIAQTPADIVAIPNAPQTNAEQQALAAAARHFSQLLFVMPAAVSQDSDDTTTRFQFADGFNNVLQIGTRPEQRSDAMLVPTGTKNSVGDAVAQTIKTLIACQPPWHESAKTLSKHDALTILRANMPNFDSLRAQDGTLSFTPCTAATQ